MPDAFIVPELSGTGASHPRGDGRQGRLGQVSPPGLLSLPRHPSHPHR